MAAQKKALGKGLGALISEEDQKRLEEAGTVQDIYIDDIEANPFQPRTEFEETALNELAESISKLGVVQPITVRKIENNRYQIISGERRHRAARIAGMRTIPSYISQTDDEGMV